MTGKEIERMRNSMPKWENGKPPVLTAEQERIDRELWCREMINSILIYYGKNNIMNDRYLKDYIEELGIETVKRLVNEQIEDFEKATVLVDVHTDYEGLSYNSIIWADEV